MLARRPCSPGNRWRFRGALWADGVFAGAPGSLRATFHPHDDLTDADVERLLRTVAARVRRWLCRHGRLREPEHDAPADDPEAAEPTLLQTLGAAAVLGRTAQGPPLGLSASIALDAKTRP